MSKSLTPSVMFNETQRIPMMHGINSGNSMDVINKLVLLDNELKSQSCKNDTEIQCIKDAQIKNEVKIQQLVDMCLEISQIVTEVKDKLSQYDIDDVDEVSDAVEDEVVEDGYNSETEADSNFSDIQKNSSTELTQSIIAVKTKSGDAHPVNMSDIDYSGGAENTNINTADDNNQTEEQEVTPKRKYNRRKR